MSETWRWLWVTLCHHGVHFSTDVAASCGWWSVFWSPWLMAGYVGCWQLIGSGRRWLFRHDGTQRFKVNRVMQTAHGCGWALQKLERNNRCLALICITNARRVNWQMTLRYEKLKGRSHRARSAERALTVPYAATLWVSELWSDFTLEMCTVLALLLLKAPIARKLSR